ncbi:MAG: ATP-binding protein [Thermostichus sp. HHBFW_bins_43]
METPSQLFNRSRRQLAGSFTAVMGGILVVFASSLYTWESHNQLRAFDEDLQAKAAVMVSAVKVELRQGQRRVVLHEVPFLGGKSQPISNDLAYVRWFEADGSLRQYVGSRPERVLSDSPGFKTLGSLRQLTIPVQQEEQLIGYLQMAVPLAPLQVSLARLRWMLVLGVPGTLALIAGAGWILGGLAMQPIRRSYLQLQRFTADASHELRAPLAALMSNAQVGILSPEQAQHRLEKVVNTTRRMSLLVETLLTLARHEGSLDVHQLPEVDLPQLFQELSQFYQPQAQAQGLTWVCEIPTGTWRVRGERHLLRQAIDNLLRNALQYTPAGGSVCLSLTPRNRWLEIGVADTGIGIPAEHLPHLGERFYRVDEARARHTGGFGLGLALVKQIATAHGGSLQISSQVGKGSQFTLQLPLSHSRHLSLASWECAAQTSVEPSG